MTGQMQSTIIGKTESGKPIYSEFNHPAHKDFTYNDHMDAINANIMSGEADSESNVIRHRAEINSMFNEIARPGIVGAGNERMSSGGKSFPE